MIKDINYNTKTIYFDNSVDDEDVINVIKTLREIGQVNASFDVVGREKHQLLGKILISKLKGKTKVVGYTDYQSYKVIIELEKKFKAVYQFTGTQNIKYYKDQFCNWYGVIDNGINYCCNYKNGTPPDDRLEMEREVFDVELLEADDK